MPQQKYAVDAKLDRLCRDYRAASPENLSSIEKQIKELAEKMDINPQYFISNLRTNRNSSCKNSYPINYFE
ncbi:hypothetical protein KY342_00280 [Candidatus Woesearchaeota archaeon]|nr:hypothetical protein [Candidatus Woesearchaeota archaeon]